LKIWPRPFQQPCTIKTFNWKGHHEFGLFKNSETQSQTNNQSIFVLRISSDFLDFQKFLSFSKKKCSDQFRSQKIDNKIVFTNAFPNTIGIIRTIHVIKIYIIIDLCQNSIKKRYGQAANFWHCDPISDIYQNVINSPMTQEKFIIQV